jgi:membrane protein DedA with SNARE-associated domain
LEGAAAHLGYLALFVGTFLEGETIVFLAGLAAHHGYLTFQGVVLVAVIGGFLGDQVFLYLGRRYGNRIFTRFPGLATRAPRVQALLRRWDVHAILIVRFLYGLRMAALIVIGSCHIALWRVVLYDFIGAVLWSLVVASLGYFAGQAIQQLAGRLDAPVVLSLLALALIAGTAWNVIRARRR